MHYAIPHSLMHTIMTAHDKVDLCSYVYLRLPQQGFFAVM